MGTQRLRILVPAALITLAIGAAACTRSASTPFPSGTDAAPGMQSSDTQATMDAVRSAILTQTAQVSEEEEGTATPEPEETEEMEETAVATEATAGATPTATLAGGVTEYTVKSGDWIFKIARQFGVDPQEIIDLNNLTNPSQLEPGTVLKIPSSSAPATEAPETGTPGTPRTPGTVHIVKAGEWIWQIARDYGVDAQDIIDTNNLTDPSNIYPGQELIIP